MPPYTQVLFEVVLASVVSLIGWLMNKSFNNLTDSMKVIHARIDRANAALLEHEKICHELPKSLLVERITAVKDSIDRIEDANYDFRQEIKKEVELQRNRYHELNTTLTRFVLKEHIGEKGVQHEF